MTFGCRLAVICLGLSIAWSSHATANGFPGEARGGGVLWYQAAGVATWPRPPLIPMWADIRPFPGNKVQVGNEVRFPVISNRVGYAHLFICNPDGSWFAVSFNQRIAAGQWQTIQFSQMAQILATRPLGRTQVTLVVTESQLDPPIHLGGSAVSPHALLASMPRSAWTFAQTYVDVTR